MENIKNLETVLKSLKLLIKVEKEVLKKSDKFYQMQREDTSTTTRARASDALTKICQERDRVSDDLHADLVDAGYAPIKNIEDYKTRIITVSCGFGHSNDIKYTPKKPKKLQRQEDV